MKKIILIAIATTFLLLQSCGGNTDMPSLSTPEGLKQADSLVKTDFKKYDGKIHAIYLGTDDHRNHTVDVVSVNFMKDSKEYVANVTAYTGLAESESLVPSDKKQKTFSFSEIEFSNLTNALKEASAQILAKDNKFHDFNIKSATFKKDDTTGKMIMEFEVMAKNPSTSYFGDRVSLKSDDFTFSFKQENGKITTADLTL